MAVSAPNRRTVALAYDGQCMFELGVATELFGLDRPELDRPWYEFQVVAATPGPLRALGGIQLAIDHDLEAIRRAGTIIVPGWGAREQPAPVPLVEALRDAHRRGARLLSICSGVYLLAATGLLDGLSVTTHWRYVADLAERYPRLDVRPNVLFMDHGQILTSAGSAAGIDLGLHLVRCDHGSDVAAAVARRLVVAPQRDGGQAQFIVPPPQPASSGGAIADLLDWLGAHLDQPLTVDDLARRVHLSPRTFARKFVAEVGDTPMRWLTRERVRRAQELLETTDLAIGEVAQAAGFGTAETLRHHFRRLLDVSPTSYRRRFRGVVPDGDRQGASTWSSTWA